MQLSDTSVNLETSLREPETVLDIGILGEECRCPWDKTNAPMTTSKEQEERDATAWHMVPDTLHIIRREDIAENQTGNVLFSVAFYFYHGYQRFQTCAFSCIEQSAEAKADHEHV